MRLCGASTTACDRVETNELPAALGFTGPTAMPVPVCLFVLCLWHDENNLADGTAWHGMAWQSAASINIAVPNPNPAELGLQKLSRLRGGLYQQRGGTGSKSSMKSREHSAVASQERQQVGYTYCCLPRPLPGVGSLAQTRERRFADCPAHSME